MAPDFKSVTDMKKAVGCKVAHLNTFVNNINRILLHVKLHLANSRELGGA
jgi:hypothetical protein